MRASLLVVLFALGCGSGVEDAKNEQAQPYVTIVVRPDRAELSRGETAQLKVLLNGNGGQEVNASFSSNDATIATVNESGLARAVSTGTVVITARYGPGTAYASLIVK